MSKESVALVRVDLPAAPIVKIEEARQIYEAIAPHANLMSPLPSHIPEMHRIVMGQERISPRTEDGQVYRSGAFCAANEVAPSKKGITDLMAAAGASMLESERTDHGKTQYVASFRVVVEVPTVYGGRARYMANKTVDYRDGSPQIAAFTKKQLDQGRQFVAELAESKALLRALRPALKLKQKYTVEEIEKPFVYLHLVFTPDMSDPEIRRMVAAKQLGLMTQLYGPSRELPALTGAIDMSPVRELPEPAHDDDGPSEPADTPEDFGAPPAVQPESEHPAHICGCTCGDQNEISEQIAATTTERGGSPRCGRCWPWGLKFDQAAHRDLGSLGLSKRPDVDGPKAISENVAWMKSRAGGAR